MASTAPFSSFSDDVSSLENPSRVTLLNDLRASGLLPASIPASLRCTDQSCPLKTEPHHAGPYTPHPKDFDTSKLPLAPHAVYDAMDWLEYTSIEPGIPGLVQGWRELLRGFDDVHSWTPVGGAKKVGAGAGKKAEKKGGMKTKAGKGKQRKEKKEPGTVIIGSASKKAKEREDAKEAAKEAAKGKEEKTEVQLPSVADEKKEANETDEISEPSDTTDTQNMREAEFVWAEDEEP
ncbi:MAG: hypothetical protein Q9202_000357 [Teloschistes flavicans]